ncbi:glucose-1-phosphate thymidylyltransferase [Micromonospora aurantiaca]|uniref:Glucose-1-phosphate thymidylyltransferase n=1 Tax=Micromonospora aurantiaca (nom. illeg.) TaxID=47850 RepID=A0ABQ6U7B7_9ACTN|nr:glucose-1-phosphate thymidylyltransferase [Micromonospora aurantiaca]KAB1102702.1 glucose-1-phosphate thymidylyltransferase [Micromonospora aurantiaca]
MFHASDFFSIDDEIIPAVGHFGIVWDILSELPELIEALSSGKRRIQGLVMDGSFLDDGLIYIEAGARIEPGVYIKGPAYIGRDVVVRHGAYIRESVILMDSCVLGHASEAKNSLLLSGASAPHFAYIGDSILGNRVNLGAGVKLSNKKITVDGSGLGGTVKIRSDGGDVDTRLTKLGAILGDDVKIGCNTVLNPGTLIGPRTLVYPGLSIRSGRYPADMILKQNNRMCGRTYSAG